jgi:membrane associated rhomboid family serine protease
MLIPIRTEAPVRRTPYVNYALIGINVVIFFLLDGVGRMNGATWGVMVKRPLMLWPAELSLFQFFTYQFLHGDGMHLFFNMFFLWLFGNAVNSKMGNVTYALFYLAGGVFAGLGFAVGAGSAPCLGASGSIAAITTAYLVLYPRSEVTVLYFFLFIGTFHVSSILWILGKMIVWDNFFAMQTQGPYTNVAYEAHLAGYLFGFVVAAAMLWMRALPRDQYDILALWRRWHQRRTYAAVMNDPVARARHQFGSVARHPDEIPEAIPVVVEPTGPIAALRARISEQIAQRDFEGAAEKYRELVQKEPAQVLPAIQQIDVANQLMTSGLFPQAADAYEKYLSTYPRATDHSQVQLFVGIIYARYLHRNDLARPHLQACLPKLTDERQREKARHWLAVIDQPPASPASAEPAT